MKWSISMRGSRWIRHGTLWPFLGRLAARRDRHALDPLSRPDPADPRRTRLASMPRHWAIPTIRSRRREPARSSTMATRCAARCRSITTTNSAAGSRPASSASAAPRARPTKARRQSRLSARRAGRTEIYPKGGSDWINVPLQGAWFPDAFVGRMANLQRFASGEDRNSSVPSRTHGTRWRWSKRPTSRARRRRRRSHRRRRPECRTGHLFRGL